MERIMRNHEYPLKTGITHTPEFAKKKLVSFAINCGVKCGHDCLYCSTGVMLRMHPAFKASGENPFGNGYCIFDSKTPERVARDAQRIKNRGMIQLCTNTDAYSPEAKAHNIGHRCIEAIMNESEWTIRVLTKNSSVIDDFDLIEKYRGRILVGLSITATLDKGEVINILEPNASSIQDRMLAMVEAATRGLRTYAMFCPLLPGIADSLEQIDQLIRFAVDCKAEEIFVEPVNPRGNGLSECQKALEFWGYDQEAKAIAQIRTCLGWSTYVRNLITNVQNSVRQHSDLTKLLFLLYPSRLMPDDRKAIKQDDAGVIRLGKE